MGKLEREECFVKSKIVLAVSGLALVLSACAEPPIEAATEPATTETTTTTTEAPTSTTTTTLLELSTAEYLALIHDASDRTDDVESGRLTASMVATALDPSAPVPEIVVPWRGSFSRDGDYSFIMDYTSLIAAFVAEDPSLQVDEGLSGEIEVRQIGNRIYLRNESTASLYGSDTEWMSWPAETGSSDYALGYRHPAELVSTWDPLLSAISQSAVDSLTVDDPEMTNGVAATHYHLVLDVDAALAEADEVYRAMLEADGGFGSEASVGVWVSERGLVVRLVLETNGGFGQSPPGYGRLVTRYDLFDLNGDVVIEPPPDDQVTAIEDIEEPSFIVDQFEEVGEVIEGGY